MRTTKYGVSYNVADSPYTVEMGGLRFYFTTKKHQDKFMEGARENAEWVCESLMRRFHVHIGAELVGIVQWYCKCETNVFYVKVLESDEVCRCPEELELDGLRPRFRGSEAR